MADVLADARIPERIGAPESEKDWFAEPPIGGYQQRYRVLRRLYSTRTAFQDLEVVDTQPYGRALLLDGTLQTSVGDEWTYHEMLVHLPLCSHGAVRRVAIVGGGDGGTLRHVLLHPDVERVVQVEIDGGVVEASKKYLPEISRGAYDDPRVELRIEDGAAYLAKTAEKFDAVLVDSTDPIGPAAVLIHPDFMWAARGALREGGVFSMQSGSPLAQPAEWISTLQAVRGAFARTRPYLGWVPIYPGVVWSWVLGSTGADPLDVTEEDVAARVARLKEIPHLYNARTHTAAFALPTFVEALSRYDHVPNQAELRAAGHPFPGSRPL